MSDGPEAARRWGSGLASLQARLEALADEPLAVHAPVLDEVYEGLVAELDALAGNGRPRDQGP